eukprot:m.49793 g.49793  ORF g.49793 m.49793 type:complete len:247 (+) comp10631_c0_seq3:152-892(+)
MSNQPANRSHESQAMVEEEIEIPMKVLIVGNGAVGKSSMIQRYCKGEYTQDYKKTIGVDFLEKQKSVNGKDLRLMIWDTAGQEEFDAMTRTYYRGAAACVVAFSTTDRASFDAVENWINKVEAECGSIPMVLVQNKIDLLERAVMTTEEGNAKAEKVKLQFYRTSVQDNYHVDDVFQYLAGEYLKKLKDEEEEHKRHKATKPKYAETSSHPNFRPQQSSDGPVNLNEPRHRGKARKKGFMQTCTLL